MEQNNPMQPFLDWTKDYTEQALEKLQAGEKVTIQLGNQQAELVAIYGQADELTEAHAGTDDRIPYFFAHNELQTNQTHALPESPAYFQIAFSLTLPEAAKQQKLAEKQAIGNGEPVVADISIEISQDGIHISGWNGLHEGLNREEDRSGNPPAEADFDELTKKLKQQIADGSLQPENLLQTVAQGLEQDTHFREVFSFVEIPSPKTSVQASPSQGRAISPEANLPDFI